MTVRKKEVSLGFSYLDVFILLLVILFFSFFVYFSAEEKRQEAHREVMLTVKAYYEEELYHAIPLEGQTLFDSNGEAIGKVLEVRTGEGEKEGEVEFLLSVSDRGYEVGDLFSVDTPSSVREGVILQVKGEESMKGEGA